MKWKFIRGLLALFKVHRYPGYISNIWHTCLVPYIVRRKGIIVGENISFSGLPLVSMVPGSTIEIGNGSSLCSISSATALGVNHPVVLRTLRPGAAIKIGNGVRMSGTTICAAIKVSIGDNTTIGANATIVDTDFHSLIPEQRKSSGDAEFALSAAVKIGPDVFIGAGSYVLKGVEIGRGSVVGAGAVVARSVPSYTIVAGNPAKPVDSVLRSADSESIVQ